MSNNSNFQILIVIHVNVFFNKPVCCLLLQKYSAMEIFHTEASQAELELLPNGGKITLKTN